MTVVMILCSNRDFVGLGDPKANVTVLNLSAVPYDVAPTVTALIGRLAFEFNFWNPDCLEFPIWLVCEEAQEYIPRASDTRYKEARPKRYWHNAVLFCVCAFPTPMIRNTYVLWYRMRHGAHFHHSPR